MLPSSHDSMILPPGMFMMAQEVIWYVSESFPEYMPLILGRAGRRVEGEAGNLPGDAGASGGFGGSPASFHSSEPFGSPEHMRHSQGSRWSAHIPPPFWEAP